MIPRSQPSLERTQDILARIDPLSKAAQNQHALSNAETSLALPSEVLNPSPSQTMSPKKALEKGSPKSPKSPKKTPKKGSPSKSPKSLKKTPKKGSPRNRGFKRSRSAQSTSSDKYSDGTYWKNLAYLTVTHVMLLQVLIALSPHIQGCAGTSLQIPKGRSPQAKLPRKCTVSLEDVARLINHAIAAIRYHTPNLKIIVAT